MSNMYPSVTTLLHIPRVRACYTSTRYTRYITATNDRVGSHTCLSINTTGYDSAPMALTSRDARSKMTDELLVLSQFSYDLVKREFLGTNTSPSRAFRGGIAF